MQNVVMNAFNAVVQKQDSEREARHNALRAQLNKQLQDLNTEREKLAGRTGEVRWHLVSAKIRKVNIGLDQLRELELTRKHLASTPELCRLVEDSGGWTLGLVRLGTACAAHTAIIPMPVSEWRFDMIEDNVMRQLRGMYDDIAKLVTDVFGMHQDGLPKLILLILSTFKVGRSAAVMCASGCVAGNSFLIQVCGVAWCGVAWCGVV